MDARTIPQYTSIQLLCNWHAGEEPHKEASQGRTSQLGIAQFSKSSWSLLSCVRRPQE